jgi:hypothetical protein
MGMSDKVNDMAFEHFIEEKPATLWRVVWWRVWGKSNNRRLRCTDYFGDEKKAWDFVGMRTETGHEIISCDQFELKPVESSSTTTLELVAAATLSEPTKKESQ